MWGEGSDKVAMFEERDRDAELASLAKAQAWRAKRFDDGFGWITGPAEYGGRELPAAYQRAYDALEAKFAVPNQSFFTIGLGMVAPTILAHGTDVAKDAYLTAMYRGDIVGCQLFSEPGAGSDLASLQTRAERDGDEWLHHRPEGVDVGRPVQRHRRDHRPHRPRPAQAQGPHRLRRRHAGARASRSARCAR